MFQDQKSPLKKQADRPSIWEKMPGEPGFGGSKINKWNDSAISLEIETEQSTVAYESGVFS